MLKKFLENINLSLVQAPGEGEAELAALNSRGLIDVVLTTDSDILVFGAHSILRRQVRHKSIPRQSDIFIGYCICAVRL